MKRFLNNTIRAYSAGKEIDQVIFELLLSLFHQQVTNILISIFEPRTILNNNYNLVICSQWSSSGGRLYKLATRTSRMGMAVVGSNQLKVEMNQTNKRKVRKDDGKVAESNRPSKRGVIQRQQPSSQTRAIAGNSVERLQATLQLEILKNRVDGGDRTSVRKVVSLGIDRASLGLNLMIDLSFGG